MLAYSAPKKQNMTKNMQKRLENKQKIYRKYAEQGRKLQNMQEICRKYAENAKKYAEQVRKYAKYVQKYAEYAKYEGKN